MSRERLDGLLAEAEIAWGVLLAATVGLADEDLDTAPTDGGWTMRCILEHVRNSEETTRARRTTLNENL